MFQLTLDEQTALRSHFATSNTMSSGRGGRRYLPYAFTEHGAIMAATILSSQRAAEISVYVVRAFVQLRELLASNVALARRLDEVEARLGKKLASHDKAITDVIEAIRVLMAPPTSRRRGIGFTADFSDTDSQSADG